jgi:hypothetical protein
LKNISTVEKLVIKYKGEIITIENIFPKDILTNDQTFKSIDLSITDIILPNVKELVEGYGIETINDYVEPVEASETDDESIHSSSNN